MTIKLTQKGVRIDAECTTCGTGIDVGVRFGSIPGETLITEFAKQHMKPGKFCKPLKPVTS